MATPRSSPPARRHLPVLKNTEGPADDAASRRPWQWVGFGALAIFTAWIPLAALAGLLAVRIAAPAGGPDAATTGTPATGLAVVAVYAGALAIGAVLGGLLVGRWGPSGVGVREAALAGLAAALVAGGVTWASFGPSPGALFLAVVAVPAAALGGRSGTRARAR
ncbi:MAG TPA: hypothetical protein VH044_06830 [Polyangiaceae bacterium]|jgi:hypothetical protein|nr:hypothetical protein [Polyangiaceae bacterium]